MNQGVKMLEEILKLWSSIPDFQLFGWYFSSTVGYNKGYLAILDWHYGRGFQNERFFSITILGMRLQISEKPVKWFTIQEITN